MCGITNIVGDASRPWMIRVQMDFLKDHIMQFKENEKFLLAVFFEKISHFYGFSRPFISKSAFVLVEHADEQNRA